MTSFDVIKTLKTNFNAIKIYMANFNANFKSILKG